MTTISLAMKVIDQWLSYQTNYADLPGFQASIRKGGKLIFSKAYGFANLASKEKYTTAHLGRIASHSKMFTACLALRLQAEGALKLEDAVIDHLPQFRRHRDKRFRDITVRDLLTNRSGLFRDGLDSPFWELEAPFLSREQLQANILASNLVYGPNLHTKYSNIGFSLLGLVLEAAGKADYKTLVKRQVLDNIGKHELLPEYKSDKKYKYAHGHSRKIYSGMRKPFKQTTTDGMIAATGFCGNTNSISHFLHTLYHTDKLLSSHVRYDLMNLKWSAKNATNQFYGLGTSFMQNGDLTFAGHEGGYPGFASGTRALLGSDYVFSFIANCNVSVGHDIIRSMAEIIRKIDSVFKPTEATTVIVSKPMMNNWGISLYILGKEKALVLPLGSWSPINDTTVLTRRKDGSYYGEEINGYSSVGEPVEFVVKGNIIQHVKFGSYTDYSVDDYVKRDKKRFV